MALKKLSDYVNKAVDKTVSVGKDLTKGVANQFEKSYNKALELSPDILDPVIKTSKSIVSTG